MITMIDFSGGTSTIFVNGIYLSFFHTRQHGPAAGVDHYFMGALTYCPHPPFHIHSMSEFPIVIDPTWYEGPWMNKVSTLNVFLNIIR